MSLMLTHHNMCKSKVLMEASLENQVRQECVEFFFYCLCQMQKLQVDKICIKINMVDICRFVWAVIMLTRTVAHDNGLKIYVIFFFYLAYL